MKVSYLIYSKPNCIFCDEAKKLLDSIDASWKEAIITPENRLELIAEIEALAARPVTTVPQIFVAEDVHLGRIEYVGGFEDLEKRLR